MMPSNVNAGGAEPDLSLEHFARSEIQRLLGPGTRVSRLEVVHAADTSTVLLATLTGPPHRIAFKVAGLDSPLGTDFKRTAAVTDLARSAGVPVPTVLEVDTTGRAGPWQYLMQEHLAGEPWRQVRPLLSEAEVAAAHRTIAETVLAMQTVRFDGFGELDTSARSAGGTLIAALRGRTERILREDDRAAFLHLLSGHEDLFDGSTLAANSAATLCHDDLHHDNVVFAHRSGRWHLAGFLDWDKAWAGPAESDVARMAFWDGMTGPSFWQAYRSCVPVESGAERRREIYQLLWCLEYDDGSDRHAADTAGLWRRLEIRR